MDVCGVGAVTGYGWGVKHVWDGFRVGESAVKLTGGLGEFVPGGQAWISVVTDEGDRRDGPSRFMQALRFAAREAVRDATERGWKPGRVVGLVHSLVLGDAELWSEFYRANEPRLRVKRWVNMMPSTVLAQFMMENDFHGPTMSVSAMCASANAGVITAKSWLDAGICDDVIVLATDLSGLPIHLQRFRDLGVQVLDRPPFDACRPFQEGSRGFVGGEAAVGMVMSSRPVGSRGTVLGGAMTFDAHNLVAVAPDRVELSRCFVEALDAAGVEASQITYVNSHGTGTAQGDAAEGKAFDEVFPDAAGIFSVKPLLGHCQAAGAAVEILATLYAFETGFVPAPPQVAPGHPRLVTGQAPREPGMMLKSSIGMGGYNTAVVIDEPPL
jgi:3-oxoacyl-[acyl-carrier-protein] synthase II